MKETEQLLLLFIRYEMSKTSHIFVINTLIYMQPRSNIFKMFDSLMLLASGQLVYFGPAKTCSNYFKILGFTIPTDYNVADYLSMFITTLQYFCTTKYVYK